MTICFFGHRQIFSDNLKQRMQLLLEKLIKAGAIRFIMGVHGHFDHLALSVCRQLKNLYPQIQINVVFTSLNFLKKDKNFLCAAENYNDVETIFYEIEEVHFKRKIIVTNKKIVDESDVVVCYVNNNKYQSGAKKVVNYAKRKNKKIFNLY